MTLFNIRKEDLDMLKRKIDRYLADWSNEQDRNSDLNIACRKKTEGVSWTYDTPSVLQSQLLFPAVRIFRYGPVF